MFTNNSGLPVVKCTVMSVFGSKPSWMDTTEMANVHILNKSCVYVNINMFNKYKLYQTNYMIKSDLISNGIPQVYHVQLFLHAHFAKTFWIFFALESQGGNSENNPIWQAARQWYASLGPEKHTPSTITWWFQPS